MGKSTERSDSSEPYRLGSVFAMESYDDVLMIVGGVYENGESRFYEAVVLNARGAERAVGSTVIVREDWLRVGYVRLRT